MKTDRRIERLFSVIEELVWDGWSWDRVRKEAASSYKEAMRRHSERECRAAAKEFDPKLHEQVRRNEDRLIGSRIAKRIAHEQEIREGRE